MPDLEGSSLSSDDPADRSRILVVDDDPDGLRATVRLLTTEGYEVLEAATGETGLALVRARQPHLVLLDISQSGISGLDVCRQIKADPSLVSVLVILVSTTHTSSDPQSTGQESGADRDVTGDISSRELIAHVQAMLRIQRTEAALRLSAERFQSLILATAQVVWTTDGQGVVVEDMPSWRAFTGQSDDDLRGWGWVEAVHPEDRSRVSAVWQQAVETGTGYHIDYRMRRHDGIYRHFSVHGVPVPEPDGSVREWIGVCADITERKAAEAERERVLEELQRTLAHVKTLEGLLPVCAWCRRIKDDQGDWEPLERYISHHSDAQFSHGICPECAQKMSTR